MRDLLREAVQDLGYYKADVGDPETHTASAQSCRVDFVFVRVDEGRIYRVGELDFEQSEQSEKLLAANEMRALFPIKKGDLFSISRLREGLVGMHKAFDNRGYIDFTAVPLITADDHTGTLTVKIDLDTGRRFFLRSMRIVGGDQLTRRKFENIAQQITGKLFTSETFATVQELEKAAHLCPDLTTQKDEPAAAVDIVLNLDAKCPSRIKRSREE